MQIPIAVIPKQSIMTKYKLLPLLHHDHVYVEICKGMYGLPQAGKIANDCPTEMLSPHGYTPMPITPGLWKDTTSDLVFALVVDDFGVKYTSKHDAECLMKTLQQLYSMSEDWTGAHYCGLTLKWDLCHNHTVDIWWTFPFLATLSTHCNASYTHLLPNLSTPRMSGKNQHTELPSSMPQHPTLWPP
jgi:hypothetical protein